MKEPETKKIVCLFPGIGYTCDKPLLYYSAKLFRGLGWEVVPVPYGGFPSGAKGDSGKMRRCAELALDQAEEMLRGIDWNGYPDILFIGKSVGTVACAAYAQRHGIACRQVLFTPVEETFRYVRGDAVVFHGTADPWADTKAVEECCARLGLPLHETEGANHSLETGDVEKDIRELKRVMKLVREFAAETEGRRSPGQV